MIYGPIQLIKLKKRFDDKMVRLDATQSKDDINKQVLQNINLYK